MAKTTEILCANLLALRRTERDLADRIERTEPASLEWAVSRAGPMCASIEHQGRSLSLSSRYDPQMEADKLVGSIDYQKSACIVLLGMGLGYHVARVVQAMGASGVLVVYEPDTQLLRAVLERVDHTGWLGRPNIILGDSALDRPELTSRLERHAGLVTQGTQLVAHPPSRQRFADTFKQFSQVVTDTLAYCRTNVATALVNSVRTCSNLARNLPYYTAGATTDELHGATAGYPAVCVGAGPSLVKNVDLLRDPALRRNVVLISVQTTLKPLLDRGIRPDFVTALDYSPICQRFYEDLAELPDVTLVAEPKAHPDVLSAFPGPLRLTPNGFNDLLLGELAQERTALRPGATVAHLSFYLAQHLGCDPIILIGQDLGFSDGLYYAPGTAVHQVWSSEINAFNTIEMMEWVRVVRHRSHLQRFDDVHGRPIFTDEQMLTYLKQFERDFATAVQTVLDATEGGMPKANTTVVTLADALDRHATRRVPKLPLPSRRLDAGRLAAALDLMQQRIREVSEIQSLSRKTIKLLKQMQHHQRDSKRMSKLFAQLNRNKHRVEHELRGTFVLVNHLNMIGAFKRMRTDRAIFHEQVTGLDRQSLQLERDLDNLGMLIQACDESLSIFNDTRKILTEFLSRTRAAA